MIEIDERFQQKTENDACLRNLIIGFQELGCVIVATTQ